MRSEVQVLDGPHAAGCLSLCSTAILTEEVSVKKLLILAAVGLIGALAVVKRQRDRELDEAIWEEPQDV